LAYYKKGLLSHPVPNSEFKKNYNKAFVMVKYQEYGTITTAHPGVHERSYSPWTHNIVSWNIYSL